MSDLALFGGPMAVTRPHPRWPRYSPETIASVTSLIDAGHTYEQARGRVVSALEDDFAHYHGSKYALLTNSGTSALHSAYFGVGIGAGDEVLCPSYTFLATVTPLFLLNAIPVLCDSEEATGNIDPQDLTERITDKTKAIIVTHLYGHPVNMPEILNIAKERSLKVIEDCSHAHGAKLNGQLVSTFGDVGVFSLGAAKMITGGTGGVLITSDFTIYERACLLGQPNRSKQSVVSPEYAPFTSTGLGCNYRISPMSALLAHSHLRELDSLIASKTNNLEGLSRGLGELPGLRTPSTAENATRGAWYGYKIRFIPEELNHVSKANFLAALQAEGVKVEESDSPPLHLLPLFQTDDGPIEFYNPPLEAGGPRRQLYARGDLPVSERIYASSLSIAAKHFNTLDTDLVAQYVSAFKKVITNLGDLQQYSAT